MTLVFDVTRSGHNFREANKLSHFSLLPENRVPMTDRPLVRRKGALVRHLAMYTPFPPLCETHRFC